MGKTSGYRAKKQDRVEFAALKDRLGKCSGSQWQKAYAIMDMMTTLLGHKGGPSKAFIAPRSCKYCGYFGHTKQFCRKKKSDEDKQNDREIARHREAMRSGGRRMSDEWIKECDILIKRAYEANELFEECTGGANANGLSCGQCENCVKWHGYVTSETGA